VDLSLPEDIPAQASDTEYLERKLSTGIKQQLLQDLGHAPRTLQLMWRLLSFSPLSVLKMAARHVSSKTP